MLQLGRREHERGVGAGRASGRAAQERSVARRRWAQVDVRIAGTLDGTGYLGQHMPRSIWTGAISFGLVNVPVKLYSAVQRKTVRFNQLDSEGNVRISMRRVNPATGEEVP